MATVGDSVLFVEIDLKSRAEMAAAKRATDRFAAVDFFGLLSSVLSAELAVVEYE